MLDYTWLTEETQAEYETVLEKHALDYLRWASERFDRKDWPLEKLYASWWFHKGPTGFRTTADAFRFKKELYEYLVKRRDAVKGSSD